MKKINLILSIITIILIILFILIFNPYKKIEYKARGFCWPEFEDKFSDSETSKTCRNYGDFESCGNADIYNNLTKKFGKSDGIPDCKWEWGG